MVRAKLMLIRDFIVCIAKVVRGKRKGEILKNFREMGKFGNFIIILEIKELYDLTFYHII